MHSCVFCYTIKLLDIKGIVNRTYMATREDLKKRVMMAARENGISTVLFRNAIGRKLGLNTTESDCLSLLATRGVSTPTELSRYAGLTSGSTTTMLDRLERAAFIKRLPNPNDRRGVLVEIDKKWSKTAAPLVAGVQKAHQELLNTYTDDELSTIADFLQRFTANIQRQTSHIDDTIK